MTAPVIGSDRGWPATATQAGMLFHDALTPNCGIYCQQVCISLRGPIDVGRFHGAWQEVTARHPALRSSFESPDGKQVVQVVHPSVEVAFTYADWSRVEPRRRRSFLKHAAAGDRRTGFDSCAAPLTRVAVLRTGEQRHCCLWSFHHALLDGWSLPIVIADVFSLYRAALDGSASPPPLGAGLTDYHDWLAARDVDAADAFWRTLLRGFTVPTELPASRFAAGTAGLPRPARVRRHLSDERTAVLYERARRCGVTLATLVQAAWALVLGRYSGRQDVVFGQCHSGRSPEIPHVTTMVGMLMNTLPTRVRIAADLSVREWLQQIQDANAAARHFDWTPLTRIQSVSDLPRQVPLFESIVILENYPIRQGVALAGGLAISGLSVRGWTNYPLTIVVARRSQRLAIELQYSQSRFQGRDMRLVCAQFAEMLQQLVEDVDRRIHDLQPSGRSAAHQNGGTHAGKPDGSGIVERFQGWTRHAPTATAVVSASDRCTYAELDRRSDAAMTLLRRAGARPGSRVAVCLDRTLTLPAWLLGLVKAGAAFVPVSARWPSHRRRLVLDDARPTLVLTNECRIREFADYPVLCAEALDGLAQAGEPPARLPPDLPAYVMYTSGSTGAPKGVEVSRGALGRVLESMQSVLKLDPTDEFLALTDLSFDIAVIELMLPLVTGARMRLSALEPRTDAETIVGEAGGVTCAQATPAVWDLLLEAGWPASRRQQLLSGGDVLPRDLAERLRLSAARAWNLYGPTEAAIWTTAAELVSDAGQGPVPIGTPLPHARVYVLDRQGLRVPAGANGEVHIGGQGVGLGYLDRPAATAERFTPDPFAEEPGARMYATGDIARWSADGMLHFVGRTDAQSKVRGVRVEAAEIETELRAHPAIAEAGVTIADGRLVAAYTCKAAWPAPAPQSLREFLALRVPTSMIPDRFVLLERLPLTSAGKIDRRAIQDAGTVPTAAREHAAPTPSLGILTRACEEVLDVSLDEDADFFAMGGDSIACLRLLLRLRASGFHLTPREVFEHPRLADLADRMRRADASGTGVSGVPDVRPHVPCE